MPPIRERIHDLSPEPRSLAHLGLGEFALEGKVRRALDAPAPAAWKPTGLDRSFYLDLMEAIVRPASAWVDARGAVIDPFIRTEYAQTTSRYVSSGAILLAFGRIPDLRETVFRAMDHACRQLTEPKPPSADFWMRELATAFMALEPIAEASRLEGWRRDLARVDPERAYRDARPDGRGLDRLGNWAVYGAVGEFLREVAGFAPAQDFLWGRGFFDKYMPAQRGHFTENGMYRDPNDPMTYDITTRLQIATALVFGYSGPLRDDLNELLRRGGLTQLLYVSPEGYAPFGGRSSQFQFQEAILSALCELEARRYRRSDPRLAGAFKRQARLSAASVRRWVLDSRPFRCIKNGFDPAAGHGNDSYARYSGYGVLPASFFGLAAIFADDDIPEAPCPAESGGFVLELRGAFHKVFATCGGTQVEIDTRADFEHDATGLGRFTRSGVPIELGPGMPITSTPDYVVPELHKAKRALAIGPEWLAEGKWARLAELSEGLESRVAVRRETREEVAFDLTWTHAADAVEVVEEYVLREGMLRLVAHVRCGGRPAKGVRLLVPLLATDGEAESRIVHESGAVSVAYRGAVLRIAFDPALSARIDDTRVANRNGLYTCLVVESANDSVAVDLALSRAGRANLLW